MSGASRVRAWARAAYDFSDRRPRIMDGLFPCRFRVPAVAAWRTAAGGRVGAPAVAAGAALDGALAVAVAAALDGASAPAASAPAAAVSAPAAVTAAVARRAGAAAEPAASR